MLCLAHPSKKFMQCRTQNVIRQNASSHRSEFYVRLLKLLLQIVIQEFYGRLESICVVFQRQRPYLFWVQSAAQRLCFRALSADSAELSKEFD